MLTKSCFLAKHRVRKKSQAGLTLIEVIVFIVVVSIAMGALLAVFNNAVINTVDPAVRIKALEKGQALMDEILARKFADNTPTGGIPACGSNGVDACTPISPENRFDDVGDYHGYSDTTDTGFPISVAVVEAGSDLGLAADAARRITVSVGMPDGNILQLTAYKVNF